MEKRTTAVKVLLGLLCLHLCSSSVAAEDQNEYNTTDCKSLSKAAECKGSTDFRCLLQLCCVHEQEITSHSHTHWWRFLLLNCSVCDGATLGRMEQDQSRFWYQLSRMEWPCRYATAVQTEQSMARSFLQRQADIHVWRKRMEVWDRWPVRIFLFKRRGHF